MSPGSGKGPDDDDEPADDPVAGLSGALPALVVAVLGVGGVEAATHKAALTALLQTAVDRAGEMGTPGLALFVVGYAFLELLGLPAIPLTLSAGALYGQGLGTAAVSVAATLGAVLAFLVSRYLVRDRVLAWTRAGPWGKQFEAMDRALETNGFRVVFLLRLSPLLPFALSNYLYGLTSVDLRSYTLGSWLGMLPGTCAYVAAGVVARTELLGGAGGLGGRAGPSLPGWGVAAAAVGTGVIVWYIGKLAGDAMKEIEAETRVGGGEGREG